MEQLLKVVEKVSLAKLGSKETSLRLLSESIKSAKGVSKYQSSQVKPLVSLTHEVAWNSRQESIVTRQDKVVSDSEARERILSNASYMIEGYYVTPVNSKK